MLSLTPTRTRQETRAPAPGGRLAWLDALRGIAALVVAFDHSSYGFVPETRWHILPWFDPGTYGVMVFFLVSGYIVPASIERHGSARRFWISRIFRIYPLLLAASAVTLLLAFTGVKGIRGDLTSHSAVPAVIAHLTMLQDLLDTPNMINVQWTLSYEMVFYLLVTALFATGLHRRSGAVAGVLAAVSLIAGTLLPTMLLSARLGRDLTIVLAAVATVGAVGLMLADPRLRRYGALLGGAVALVLVVLNGRVEPWQGLLIIAVMFTGTAIYRAEQGQIPAWVAVAAGAGTLAAGLAHSPTNYRTGLLAAAATFAIGMALRHRRFPTWLAWLGAISYSVYLLHPVLLMVTDGTIGRWTTDQPLLELAFLGVLIALCALSHRFIEQPGQRLGRRLTAGRAA